MEHILLEIYYWVGFALVNIILFCGVLYLILWLIEKIVRAYNVYKTLLLFAYYKKPFYKWLKKNNITDFEPINNDEDDPQ